MYLKIFRAFQTNNFIGKETTIVIKSQLTMCFFLLFGPESMLLPELHIMVGQAAF